MTGALIPGAERALVYVHVEMASPDPRASDGERSWCELPPVAGIGSSLLPPLPIDIESLIHVLECETEDAVAMKAAFAILRYLIDDPKTTQGFVSEHGIDPLMVALTRHATDPSIAGDACCLLRWFIQVPDYIDDIFGAGKLQSLATVLTVHINHPAIVGDVCSILHSLDKADANEQVAVAMAGGIQPLVTVLTLYADNPAIVGPTCGILWGVMVNRQDGTAAGAAAGGIPILITAMTRHAEDARVIESATAALDCFPARDYGDVITGAGGIRALVAALTTHVGSALIVKAATRALGGLVLFDNDRMVAMAAAGSIEALVNERIGFSRERPSSGG